VYNYVMAFVLVAILVLALACAAWVDHRDRKHHRRQRDSGEMIRNRRQRIRDLRSTPEPGVPSTELFNPATNERMRDQPFGDY
jgi:hypothetical protein